mmetsp:Transcript_1930/g.4375  ORF Transcript_1930/g.4375 Transcript_1930/m.4375 type:complete len:567 (-) Transcript_1930:66-1766(-)
MAVRPLLLPALLAVLRSSEAVKAKGEEQYSTNAICRQNLCINPIFPGLEDMSMLETLAWQCQSSSAVRSHMQFCRDAINYDVALPSSNTSVALTSMVATQDKAAVTMYYYHLAGMNLEAWDHKHPEKSDDSCIRAVWKMVCNTYFPKAEAGCTAGQSTTYARPCKNVCGNYVAACNVQCCDESNACVFEHKESLLQGGSVTKSGYYNAEGPSALCTGAAARAGATTPFLLAGLLSLSVLSGSAAMVEAGPAKAASMGSRAGGARRWRSLLLTAPLVVVAASLQGCEAALGKAAAAWEAKASYVVNYQFIPVQSKNSGAWQISSRSGVLNSCDVLDLPKSQQCSGNGVCKQWNPSSNDSSPISFCECDRDWADPECRTKRKSQASAFLLSLFFGFLGADHFYIGEYYTAFGKLATLGGLGFWWIIDVVRIGSSPVYASDFRLAADLPHWVYVGLVSSFFACLGFLVFGVYGSRVQKRLQLTRQILEAEDNFFKSRSAAVDMSPQDRVGMARKSSYGLPLPATNAYGTLTPAEAKSGFGNPLSSYTAYAIAAGDPSYTGRQGGPLRGA